MDDLPAPTPYPYTTETEARLRLLEQQERELRGALLALVERVKRIEGKQAKRPPHA